MRVFVTGGTGEIGRPAVSSLVARGHVVHVASRGTENDKLILSMGAVPLRVDLFDRESVQAAVAEAQAILHLATRIPPTAEMGDPDSWEENDRLRRETTADLIEAAVRHSVDVFVLQSYFAVGAPAADRWVDDRTRLPAPPWSGIGAMESMREAELAMARLESAGTRAVTLRFGSLYSETSEQLHAQVAALLSAGPFHVVGSGENFWPFIASRDAGEAVSHALMLPTGTYWVSDDVPVSIRAFWETAAATLEVDPPLFGAPGAGPMADILLGSWRISNRRFRHAARWAPQEASVLEGWARAVRRLLAQRGSVDPVSAAAASAHPYSAFASLSVGALRRPQITT